jgi:hypothetical protein
MSLHACTTNTISADAFVHCPDCGAVASIEWTSTFGRVQHAKVRCIHRHWFLLPVDLVTEYPRAA